MTGLQKSPIIDVTQHYIRSWEEHIQRVSFIGFKKLYSILDQKEEEEEEDDDDDEDDNGDDDKKYAQKDPAL